MAHRSYLYVVDEIPGEAATSARVRGLSEWKGDVPLVHLILITGSPRLVPSTSWNAPTVAILGDFDQGVANLERLFAQLPANEETQRQIAEARGILSDPSRRGRYLLLEVAEIHQLGVSDDQNPHPEMREEAERLLYTSEDDVDSLLTYALTQSAENLAELTGSGSWARNLYYAPVALHPPPAPAATQYWQPSPPPAARPQAPAVVNYPPVRPASGQVPWGLGLLALFPIPFLSAMFAGALMIILGRGKAPSTRIGEQNRANAASWGLTYLILTIILAMADFLMLFHLDDEFGETFFPIGIPLTVWLVLSVLHIGFCIVGLTKAGNGTVFTAPAVPFFGPRGE